MAEWRYTTNVHSSGVTIFVILERMIMAHLTVDYFNNLNNDLSPFFVLSSFVHFPTCSSLICLRFISRKGNCGQVLLRLVEEMNLLRFSVEEKIFEDRALTGYLQEKFLINYFQKEGKSQQYNSYNLEFFIIPNEKNQISLSFR